jgi:thiosulfate dehydrogenase
MPDNQNRNGSERTGSGENAPGEERASNSRENLAPAPSLSFAVVVAVTVAIIGAAVSLIFSTFVTTRPIPAPTSQETMKQHQVTQSTSKLTFNPPALGDAPKDMQEAVNRGHRILMDTRKEVPQYVGNQLDCRNCHFEAGRIRKTLSLVGVAAVYPKYQKQRGRSVDLVEQTNACFERNLKGKPLSPDSNDMQAIVAYCQWISKGIPIYADVPWLGLQDLQSNHKPDASNGKTLFGERCSACHGQDGQGTKIAPPLWGDSSFTDGASMAHVQTFAAFDHAFMPKGNPDLKADEALDIAAYVTSQPRPHYKQ